jgi:AcrR family transcriptional regulator
MLQHALVSLILEKGYEAITIEDICERANVGRSTFYAHYTGKDDLKRRGLDAKLRGPLAERQKAALDGPGALTDRRLGFSLALFEHARDHLDLYRALAGGRGGAVSLDGIRQILSDLVRDELAGSAAKSEDAIPRELIVTYVVGAYMAVLTWWLDGGAKLPAHRIDAMFRRLAVGGVIS